jgi:hypothetical protein
MHMMIRCHNYMYYDWLMKSSLLGIDALFSSVEISHETLAQLAHVFAASSIHRYILSSRRGWSQTGQHEVRVTDWPAQRTHNSPPHTESDAASTLHHNISSVYEYFFWKLICKET